MESYGIVSARRIEMEDLRLILVRKGGHWPNDRRYGILQDGEARIEVHTGELSNSYSDEELGVLKRILDANPVSSVGVAYSTNEASEQMAREFCDELIENFGGYFENNLTELVSEPREP
jgi:hypothetical protein